MTKEEILQILKELKPKYEAGGVRDTGAFRLIRKGRGDGE